MTEGYNFEEINKNFGQIGEVLDAIKTQNALNIGDTSRILNNISVKLDNISGDETNDTIRDLLFDLKKSLDDRYSLVNVKFAELETSFKILGEKNVDVITTPQMKELFDILTTNITVFSKQMMTQGDILNEITLRIEALRTDDTDKREIIKTVNLLKGDLDKFNNGFESIILNVNNNFEIVLEQLSHVDPTTGVNELKLSIEALQMTVSAIMSAMQILDQKNISLENSINEVIVQNTKINANIKALAGQSDFDGLVRKVEGSIELMTTLKGALTDANDQSQKALLLQLDKFSSVASKILTDEDFDMFKSELSKLVYDVIETTNVMRGDLLNTTSEFKNLISLIESLDLKNSFQGLNDLINNYQRNIKASIIETISTSGIEPLKENISLLIQRVDKSKEVLSQSLEDNQMNVVDKLENLSTNLAQLKESVTFMPDVIKENYMSIEEGQRNYVEQSSRELSVISENLKILQTEISKLSAPIKENILKDVNDVKELVYDIKGLVSFGDELVVKVSNLETILGRVAGDYDVALHTVQDGLIQYMSGIKEDCESTDIKMNNFAFELNSLKSETQKSFGDMKIENQSQNEKFNQVCNGIASRFDDVIKSISTISSGSISNDGTSLKAEFDRVTQYLQDILYSVAQIKTEATPTAVTIEEVPIMGANKDEFLKIESRLNKLKDQFNFVSTDIMENLYNRTEVILKDFEPVKSAIMSFVDVDFQSVAVILKEQMHAYKSTMEQVISEVNDDGARSVLNNLFSGLGTLENKVLAIENNLKESQLGALSEIKDLIKNISESVPAQSSSEVVNASFDTQGLIDKIEEKIVDIKSDYTNRFENIHNHLNGSFENFNNIQNEIVSKIDEIKNISLTDNSQKLSEIKNQINELFEKMDKVQEAVCDYHQNFLEQPVSEAKLSGLDEDERNIITDFSKNMSELASIVRTSGENIDEKIASALAQNEVNVDFEGLKNDIAQMISSVQERVTCVVAQDRAEGQPLSELEVVFEEYKFQIINEINSVKQAMWDFKNNDEMHKDIQVINQKMDLIALNDDAKFEIEKSLAEIKVIIQDQQKLFQTINILETLATLDDINKLKGIENLNKLSEIISVDKLNALNKLNLLDKLQNIDCLDELQNIPKLSGMVTIQEQLKNIIVGLDQKLNVFSKNYSTLDLVSEDFKNELNLAKTAIMKHVLNVFEQLSFVVEGEEIKDFVQEKTDEVLKAVDSFNVSIDDNLSKEIKAINHSINSMQPLEYSDIAEDMKKLDGVSIGFDGVKGEIDEVKKQLNLIKSGTTEGDVNYNYALQDVETDIAKLRLTLDDMKKVVENNSLREIADYVNEIVQQVDSMKFNISQDDIFKMKVDIEKITADIVSISARTNKLLLVSDESNRFMQTNLGEFKSFMSGMYDSLKRLDYTQVTDRLETINNAVAEGNRQQKNMQESVAKLSIWADNADENFVGINENLNRLKKSMPTNEVILEDLEAKFAKQQQKIDSLENKIEELLGTFDSNETVQMAKKITNIDKQLTKLNKSIERLTSYVDEE